MLIVDIREDKGRMRLEQVLRRSPDLNTQLLASVSSIIEEVRKRGDEALIDFTRQYDGLTLADFKVSPEQIEEIASQVSPELIAHIETAIESIRAFHNRQVDHSWEYTDTDGVTLGQRITPLDSVGLYVPGGRAAYPSSVIMNAVPAQVAGVQRIVLVTPPATLHSNPVVAATIRALGLNEVYSVGGAQAIAALAYGTETIRRVDKIVGPGNRYVAAAKKLVFGTVDIDSIAGPSEILVIADASAPAHFIAADLLSQAEHDEEAAALLITDSPKLADRVSHEVELQLARLPRRHIAEKSIEAYGTIFLVPDMNTGLELANTLAAEHVEIMTKDPDATAAGLRHAGAIFFGIYSCEAAGDYLAGPNHVLPTGTTARFSSPLGVYDFIKRSSIIKYTKQKLYKTAGAIAALAESEGLEGHARAALIRLTGEE